jgi:hypothetical protein
MPLFESVSAPRIHDQLLYQGSAGMNVKRSTLPQGPDIVLLSRTRAALERRGHNLIENRQPGGGAGGGGRFGNQLVDRQAGNTGWILILFCWSSEGGNYLDVHDDPRYEVFPQNRIWRFQRLCWIHRRKIDSGDVSGEWRLSSRMDSD